MAIPVPEYPASPAAGRPSSPITEVQNVMEMACNLSSIVGKLADALVGAVPEKAMEAHTKEKTLDGLLGQLEGQAEYTRDAINRAHGSIDRIAKALGV